MSDTVITVTANQEIFEISFDERTLAELGEHNAELIMQRLRHFVDSYMDLVNSQMAFNNAKGEWEIVKRSGKAELTVGPDSDYFLF